MKKIKIESIMKIILLFTEFAIIKMKTNSKSQLTPQVRVTTNIYRKKKRFNDICATEDFQNGNVRRKF